MLTAPHLHLHTHGMLNFPVHKLKPPSFQAIVFFPILSHIITSHSPPDIQVSKAFLSSQNEIRFILLSTPRQGAAVNGNLAYRRRAHSHIIAFSFAHR